MAHIRQSIFGVKQSEFAAIAGVTQGTVSRWEQGRWEPTREQLASIRDEAGRRGIEWDDGWFFEPVPAPQEARAE